MDGMKAITDVFWEVIQIGKWCVIIWFAAYKVREIVSDIFVDEEEKP